MQGSISIPPEWYNNLTQRWEYYCWLRWFKLGYLFSLEQKQCIDVINPTNKIHWISHNNMFKEAKLVVKARVWSVTSVYYLYRSCCLSKKDTKHIVQLTSYRDSTCQYVERSFSYLLIKKQRWPKVDVGLYWLGQENKDTKKQVNKYWR